MANIIQYIAKPSPKQTEIISDLLKRIQSGELSPGAELPSVADLSVRYKASTTTVQRAMVRLRGNGYLQTSKRGSCIVDNPPHLSNFGLVRPFMPFRSQFIVALENEGQRLAETGISPSGTRRRFTVFDEIDCPAGKEERYHRDLVAAVESETVAGLFFCRPPHRFVGTAILRNPHVPCVTLADEPVEGVARLQLPGFHARAFDLLVARGRRRVAIMTITGRSDAFLQDVRDMAAARGVTTHPWWIQGVYPADLRWAGNCAQMLIHSGPERPDALIIDDDNLVPAATAGIAATGLHVPDDLDVVAHANFPWTTPSAVPAIRFGTNVRLLIRTAVDIIERKRSGEEAPVAVLMPACSEDEATQVGDEATQLGLDSQ